MIGWDDMYKVVSATVPLYVAMILGYASIKWFNLFTADHCEAINRFNAYFILPFFMFNFLSQLNPYQMNYMFIASDIIAKGLVIISLAIWAYFAKNGSRLDWSITTYTLSTLNSTLIFGLPLLQAMYGKPGFDITLQSAGMGFVFWLTLMLFGLEFRRARLPADGDDDVPKEGAVERDVEANIDVDVVVVPPPSIRSVLKTVCLKLAYNPNTYGCYLGLIWALIANRWHLTIPIVIQNSVSIMSKAGGGVSMFTTGLYMGLQDHVISCGWRLTFYGLFLRFIIGPVTSAIGAAVLGIRGDTLKIIIIQAALPELVAAFVYAKAYGLHANVLNTVVVIGTLISLPLLMGYYAALEMI